MICEGLELPPEITAKFAGDNSITTASKDDYITSAGSEDFDYACVGVPFLVFKSYPLSH